MSSTQFYFGFLEFFNFAKPLMLLLHGRRYGMSNNAGPPVAAIQVPIISILGSFM